MVSHYLDVIPALERLLAESRGPAVESGKERLGPGADHDLEISVDDGKDETPPPTGRGTYALSKRNQSKVPYTDDGGNVSPDKGDGKQPASRARSKKGPKRAMNSIDEEAKADVVRVSNLAHQRRSKLPELMYSLSLEPLSV